LSPKIDTFTLGMMTKYWDVGQVKTRLGASVGMRQAAALHRLFVAHLCTSLAHVAERNTVCLSPDSSLGRFQRALNSWGLEDRWDTMPQGTGNLGERMGRWFERCLDPSSASGSSRAILIGADCPTLDADLIRSAGDSLKKRDVVLGPAADGGYYLIGLRGPWQSRRSEFESLFRDIPWSTDQVMGITRRRLGSAGLSNTELDVREDVDTLAELDHLRQSVATDDDRHAQLKSGIEQILTGTFRPADTPK
jgi:hypothetical protein